MGRYARCICSQSIRRTIGSRSQSNPLITLRSASQTETMKILGGVAVPGAIVGIFLGGFIMKRYKLQLHGIASLIVLINLSALGLLTLFFWLGCSNPQMAGVFSTYNRFKDWPPQFNVPEYVICYSSTSFRFFCRLSVQDSSFV